MGGLCRSTFCCYSMLEDMSSTEMINPDLVSLQDKPLGSVSSLTSAQICVQREFPDLA